MPGRGRGRGRRRNPRWVSSVPETTFFSPAGVPPMSARTMVLTVVEVEALRLVDLENLTQEQAAMEMGVSRRTFWNDLMSARRKVAFALVNGCAIRIAGGAYSVVGEMSEREMGGPRPQGGRGRGWARPMPRHEDCRYFENGQCVLKGLEVRAEGTACPEFEVKKERR
jgi:predicted DNA-binding protein (UPF0251 family)